MIRCGEHSDYGSITLLIQDDLGGLEVKSVNHGWIEATPVKGAILVTQSLHFNLGFVLFGMEC